MTDTEREEQDATLWEIADEETPQGRDYEKRLALAFRSAKRAFALGCRMQRIADHDNWMKGVEDWVVFELPLVSDSTAPEAHR